MQMKTFAQQTNLPPKTIRYYEGIGLLPQPQRLDNGYRDYNETDVARAKFVAGARRFDFSLDDIQEILDLRDRREAPCRIVLNLLEEKADEISRRIAELQRMEAKLRVG
jgi:DNA-binding transcriptional MerR regulator